MKRFFTPKDVTAIVGLTYRQIQYWHKTDFIGPSYRSGSGDRLYTFRDLIQLGVCKILRDASFSVQRLRVLIKSLRSLLTEVKHPMVDVSVLIEGDRILIFNGEVLMNKQTAKKFIRFDASTLRDEADRLFPEELDYMMNVERSQ